MVGILIATHGTLADGFQSSIELIMGKQSNVKVLSLYHETAIGEFGDLIVDTVRTLDCGKGVLVFVDLFAASPYNQAVLRQEQLSDIDYRVISGVNLPMLLETIALINMGMALDDIWKTALEAGKDGIREFRQEFEKYTK